MSHLTTITGVQITNPESIRAAVAQLVKDGRNIRLEENYAPRMFDSAMANDVGVCEFAIVIPDERYDVGLKYNPETKTYDLKFDPYTQGVRRGIGKPADQVSFAERKENPSAEHYAAFMEEYLVAEFVEKQTAQGYSVERSVNSNGEITVTAVSEGAASSEQYL